MSRVLVLLGMLCCCVSLNAQEFIPLWPEGKKLNWNGIVVTDSLHNERIWRVSKPGLYAFLVPQSENKGTTILICPGGGYERLSHIYNGFNFAKWFNAKGINVFVLIYRLPHQRDLKNRHLAPLTDAQRAMRMIRGNYTKWHLDPKKIGVMGISAGGHVASTLGTFQQDISSVADSFDAISFRPDFMILLSPVISMGRYAHPGSKRNLLGADTSKALIEKFSIELQVGPGTPPVFMVHAQNDSTVKVQNSVLFYQALVDQGVQASIHVFPQGGHGIGLFDNPGSTELWLPLLHLWLTEKSFVLPRK